MFLVGSYGEATHRSIHWLSWDKLTVHKFFGGMSFKDLITFNLAMLGKQGWKLQTQPDCLVSRISKARYFLENILDVYWMSGLKATPTTKCIQIVRIVILNWLTTDLKFKNSDLTKQLIHIHVLIHVYSKDLTLNLHLHESCKLSRFLFKVFGWSQTLDA